MNGFINVDISEYSGAFYQGPIAHLMVVTHFVQKVTLEKLAEGQRDGKLNLAYEVYISLLAEENYPPGELAAKLGISKQACSKIIKELETLGLIERRKNPQDSRSSLLSLTDKGRQLLQDSIKASNEIYRRFATEVDGDRLQQLVEILEKLRSSLGIELTSCREPGQETRIEGERPKSLNLLLPGLVDYFKQTLLVDLSDKGFAGLKSSFGQVLGLLNREERRIQYIASVIGVSKQAIAVTAADLEQAGYITRATDPGDKRQIILRLTPLGKQLLNESVASVRSLEASIEQLLHDHEYRVMDDTLAVMYLQVAEHYDAASVLPAKIQQISEHLLAELGVTGARSLAQHLMTITRG